MLEQVLNNRSIEGLKNVDLSGQKLRHFEFIHVANRLRDHRFAEIVNLSLTNLTRRSAIFLADALPTVQMLEVLDLRYNAVDDDSGVRICFVGCNAYDMGLYRRIVLLDAQIAVVQATTKLRHLHKIDLSWNILTSVFVSRLRPILPDMKFLTEFYIHGNPLKNAGIVDICSQMLTNTTIVDLKIGWCGAKVRYSILQTYLHTNRSTSCTL